MVYQLIQREIAQQMRGQYLEAQIIKEGVKVSGSEN